MNVTPQFSARHDLNDEELALLRHLDLGGFAQNMLSPWAVSRQTLLVDESAESHFDVLSYPGLSGFRERLALGDISW
ncbi:MAG: hypothetical protein ABI896_05405 [Actinomycetota bacterium]